MKTTVQWWPNCFVALWDPICLTRTKLILSGLLQAQIKQFEEMNLRSGRIISSPIVAKTNSTGLINYVQVPAGISRRQFAALYIREIQDRIMAADDQIEKIILHTNLFKFLIANYDFIISYDFMESELRNKFIRNMLKKCREYQNIKLEEPGNDCEIILQNNFRRANKKLASHLQQYVNNI